jgi:hypothetical protein
MGDTNRSSRRQTLRSPAALLVFISMVVGMLLSLGGRRAAAGDKAPALTSVFAHPSGAFRVRTPAGWMAGKVTERPEIWQLTGDEIVIRFFYRNDDAGFDGLHISCMNEHLLNAMEVSPKIKYEHDFLQGNRWGRRVLDSAFIVQYDRPVLGHREWRQHNVTIVGNGQSLCVVSHCPLVVWKRSKPARVLSGDILDSLDFGGGS